MRYCVDKKQIGLLASTGSVTNVYMGWPLHQCMRLLFSATGVTQHTSHNQCEGTLSETLSEPRFGVVVLDELPSWEGKLAMQSGTVYCTHSVEAQLLCMMILFLLLACWPEGSVQSPWVFDHLRQIARNMKSGQASLSDMSWSYTPDSILSLVTVLMTHSSGFCQKTCR